MNKNIKLLTKLTFNIKLYIIKIIKKNQKE